MERRTPSRGEFYAEVMHESPDGWRPVFEPRQMLKSRQTWVYDAHWEELAQVRCPALVVRGLDGELGRAEAQEMVRVLPRGQYAEVADAGPPRALRPARGVARRDRAVPGRRPHRLARVRDASPARTRTSGPAATPC